MLIRRSTLTTLFFGSLLASAGCDKEESLGEIETESETSDPMTTTGESDSGIACPADAMVCPDGTAVGRSGPDCEFDPCPGGTSDSTSTSGDPTDPSSGGEDTMCPGDSGYFEPAACPSEDGPAPIEPGCFASCVPNGDECGDGFSCRAVEINPCVCDGADEGVSCCGACSAEASLCLPVAQGDACDGVFGSFSSIEELECGIAPKGEPPALCNWTVTLGADGTYVRMYSDVGEGGDYYCDDGGIFADGAWSPTATYDPEADTLTWEDVVYERDDT